MQKDRAKQRRPPAPALVAALLVGVSVAAGCGDFGEAPEAVPPPGDGGADGDGGNGGPAARDTVSFAAALDNSMFAEDAGRSNGAGRFLQSGRSFNGSVRRALLRFAVSDSLSGAVTVHSARLSLHVSAVAAPDARMFGLHRVTTRWGEGGSVADMPGSGGGTGGGGGAAATPGDATWSHAVFDTLVWNTPGGDFAVVASAGAAVADTGVYVWENTPELAADVEAWVADPSTNLGWILWGDESAGGTAKRFDSRESPVLALRPRLEVIFTPVALP